MDLATRVNYDFLYRLELKDIKTDEPNGVVFMIRSAVSDSVEEISQTHFNRNIERRVKGKLVTAEIGKQQELEKTAALIASWDWGDNTFNGSVPEFKLKTVIEVMKVHWIYQQVVEAANNTANFSQE